MTDPVGGGAAARLGRGSEAALVGGLALSALSFAVMQAVVVPALPAIQAGFEVDQSEATWVLTVALLASSVSTPLLGRLGDVWGRRRVLLGVLATLAVGVVIAAMAPSFGLFLAGRVLQGLGGAIFPLAFGIVDERLPTRRAAPGIGLVSSMSAAGLAVGVLVAAMLVGQLGFRHTFLVLLVPVVIAFGMVVVAMPAGGYGSAGSVNWLSAMLMGGWLSALLLALAAVAPIGWSSPMVLLLLAGATVLTSAWIAVELHSAAPLVDLRMLRSPAVAFANGVALLLGFMMYSAFAFVPLFGQTLARAGGTPGGELTSFTAFLLPWAIAAFVAGLASGPAAVRFGARSAVVTGVACTAAAFVLIALVHQPWQVAACSAVIGLGSGLATGAVAVLVVGAVVSDLKGVASSVTANSRLIGGAIGTQVFTTVLAIGAPAGAVATVGAYQRGFVMLAVVGAAALAAAVAIPRMVSSPAAATPSLS